MYSTWCIVVGVPSLRQRLRRQARMWTGDPSAKSVWTLT
jgi:hypothetical protein